MQHSGEFYLNVPSGVNFTLLWNKVEIDNFNFLIKQNFGEILKKFVEHPNRFFLKSFLSDTRSDQKYSSKPHKK